MIGLLYYYVTNKIFSNSIQLIISGIKKEFSTRARGSDNSGLDSDDLQNNEDDQQRNEGGNIMAQGEGVGFFQYVQTMIREKKVHKLRTEAPVETFKTYCELCLPILVGKQYWKMNHTFIGVRAMATVADEALLALILENNIEEWTALARGGVIDKNNRHTLYTHGGKEGRRTRKGWSLQGVERYNELHKEVKEERKKPSADAIEEELKLLWSNSKKGNAHHRDDENDTDGEQVREVEAVFDFDD